MRNTLDQDDGIAVNAPAPPSPEDEVGTPLQNSRVVYKPIPCQPPLWKRRLVQTAPHEMPLRVPTTDAFVESASSSSSTSWCDWSNHTLPSCASPSSLGKSDAKPKRDDDDILSSDDKRQTTNEQDKGEKPVSYLTLPAICIDRCDLASPRLVPWIWLHGFTNTIGTKIDWSLMTHVVQRFMNPGDVVNVDWTHVGNDAENDIKAKASFLTPYRKNRGVPQTPFHRYPVSIQSNGEQTVHLPQIKTNEDDDMEQQRCIELAPLMIHPPRVTPGDYSHFRQEPHALSNNDGCVIETRLLQDVSCSHAGTAIASSWSYETMHHPKLPDSSAFAPLAQPTFCPFGPIGPPSSAAPTRFHSSIRPSYDEHSCNSTSCATPEFLLHKKPPVLHRVVVPGTIVSGPSSARQEIPFEINVADSTEQGSLPESQSTDDVDSEFLFGDSNPRDLIVHEENKEDDDLASWDSCPKQRYQDTWSIEDDVSSSPVSVAALVQVTNDAIQAEFQDVHGIDDLLPTWSRPAPLLARDNIDTIAGTPVQTTFGRNVEDHQMPVIESIIAELTKISFQESKACPEEEEKCEEKDRRIIQAAYRSPEEWEEEDGTVPCSGQAAKPRKADEMGPSETRTEANTFSDSIAADHMDFHHLASLLPIDLDDDEASNISSPGQSFGDDGESEQPSAALSRDDPNHRNSAVVEEMLNRIQLEERSGERNRTASVGRSTMGGFKSLLAKWDCHMPNNFSLFYHQCESDMFVESDEDASSSSDSTISPISESIVVTAAKKVFRSIDIRRRQNPWLNQNREYANELASSHLSSSRRPCAVTSINESTGNQSYSNDIATEDDETVVSSNTHTRLYRDDAIVAKHNLKNHYLISIMDDNPAPPIEFRIYDSATQDDISSNVQPMLVVYGADILSYGWR